MLCSQLCAQQGIHRLDCSSQVETNRQLEEKLEPITHLYKKDHLKNLARRRGSLLIFGQKFFNIGLCHIKKQKIDSLV
jgi:hypothetical protein